MIIRIYVKNNVLGYIAFPERKRKSFRGFKAITQGWVKPGAKKASLNVILELLHWCNSF